MRSHKTDNTALQAVIAATYEKEQKEAEAVLASEKKLKEITVKREDLEFLLRNCDLTIALADRALRMNGGDLQATLKMLMTPTSLKFACRICAVA